MKAIFGAKPGWVAMWALLTVYFLAPPNQAMTWELDSSNYGSYAWMTETGRQFGTEVIAMTGPLGYLAYGTTYNGDLFEARFVGDLLLKAGFAFLLLALAARTTGGRRWAWLGLTVVFLPNVGDLFPDFAILSAGLWLLTGDPKARPGFTSILAAGLLGVMGLMKGTNTLVAGATLVAVVLSGLIEKRPGRALLITGVAALVFFTGWIATRQEPGHLPAYFRGVWELANGYNETMGLTAAPRDALAGFVLAAGLTLLLGLAAWSVRRDWPRLLVVLFLGGFTFLKWKHGFVRADGHVHIFFNFSVLVLAALWLVLGRVPDTGGRVRRIVLPVLAGGVFLVGTAAASEFRWARLAAMFTDAPRNFSAHAAFLFSPGKVRTALDQELARHRLAADLPQVRTEVGDATIDFFGYEEGILLLNRLDYHPRPMGGGSFNVFTRYLQEANEAFIRDQARRPLFELVKLQTLDGRLPAADDPLTLNALLELYSPVRAQRDYVLFKRNDSATSPPLTLLRSVRARLGEPVTVPAVPGRDLVLFKIEARYSATGRVRGLVYRPPLLEIELSAGVPTATKTFRLAPGMARVPVILSPLLENNRDLLGLYGAGETRQVQQLTLRSPEPAGFAGEFELTFYSQPAPAVPPDNLAGELLTYLEHPVSNRPALELVTQETGIHELYEEPITLVHAPGHITFPLNAGDQQVIFNYGLMPQSYDPGRTKGVEFVVETIRDGRPATVLFSRLLEPVTRAGDRGMQWARVYLPPDIAGRSLRLRTTTGPTGDGAWAQSYFAHVQVKPGPLDPRQFSGFSAAPLPPGFAGHEELTIGGRTVRSFPPPTAFTFPIPSEATRVTLAAGLQPSAYAGENRTDGFEVLVYLSAPGREPELLHRHFINPRERLSDRGTQTFVVALPPDRPPGAQLVLRSGPGPANDDRWDWGYLQTVYFSGR